MRTLTLAAALVAAALGTAPAEARQVCLPGTGLSCGSGGDMPDPGPRIAARNQRVAAGFAAAGALVDLLGVVLDLVDRSSAAQPDDSRDIIRRLEQGERIEACRVAAAWAASGTRQLMAGDYTSAHAHFRAAVTRGRDGHCNDALEEYERNASLTSAYESMLTAIEMIGAKRYKEAENQLMVASSAAFSARARELQTRIIGYRRGLHDKVAKGTAFKERTACIEVNGELECD